jgi:hypothetical protein
MSRLRRLTVVLLLGIISLNAPPTSLTPSDAALRQPSAESLSGMMGRTQWSDRHCHRHRESCAAASDDYFTPAYYACMHEHSYCKPDWL